VLPPFLADATDRAIVSAPVALITAPIEGEVRSLTGTPGEPLQGQRLARIRNDRVDRSTLIGLENQAAAARLQVAAVQDRRGVLTALLQTLDRDIETQRSYLLRHAQALEAEARARAAAAEAGLGESAQLARRQEALRTRGVVTSEAVELVARRKAAAREEAAAAGAVLVRRIAEREAVESGVYVGEGMTTLASLTEKRREMAFELARAGIEERQARSALETLSASAAAEADRLARLVEAEVVAPNQGVVLKVDLASGQHVQPGDTLATAVDCRRSLIAAIFSVRQASRLDVGARVDLTGQHDGRTLGHGTVVQILPRTTDRVDQGYAVPFPPIERREMYVLIEPDMTGAGWMAEPPGETPCSVGRWVTVTLRGGGWMGKAFETGRQAFLRARNALLPVARAAAH
jgi:multidrug resistance efflux pump